MPQINTEQYNQLKKILTKMFQLDQAELDFGIYRIMNQKRAEINDFLDHQLLVQIQETLQESGDPALEETKKELIDLENTLQGAGVNPDENDKVKTLRQQVAAGGSLETTELEVYSRLTQFFKRYYKEGDFISQRRYKEGVYAIPYEGEEVKLHWANHDQYYIKTGEHFKNYSFKADGKKINFVLKEADTERDNNKAQTGKERRFKLFHDPEKEGPTFEEIKDNELNIYFTYEPTDKKGNQDKFNKPIFKELSQSLPGKWTQVLLTKRPAEKSKKSKKRTLLEYRLSDYTNKNSFDYFIHKDLGKFLRQELDFYIKNEILHLDDINLEEEQDFNKQLTLIKGFKKVSLKIIDFLAQLENFQKKLWLKKKMVLQSDYCITLDRIDMSFYEDIAKNKKQLQEWKELFSVDEIEGFEENIKTNAVEVLKANPYLLVDTQFFSTEWKYKLLATIPDLDKQCDGLMINSENFQALNLLQKKFKGNIGGIYIDPPYNTGSDGFYYKDNYKHSSWITSLNNRLNISHSFIKETGACLISIDENELDNLLKLGKEVFHPENFINIINVKTKIAGVSGSHHGKSLQNSTEYILMYSKELDSFYLKGSVYDETELMDFIKMMKFEGKSWKYVQVILDEGERIERKRFKDGAGDEIILYEHKGYRFSSIKRVAEREFDGDLKKAYYKYITKIFDTTNAQSSIRKRVMENSKDITEDLISITYVPKSGRNKGKETNLYYKGPKQRLFTWLKDTVDIREDGIFKKVNSGNLFSDIQYNNIAKEGGISFENGKKPVALLEKAIGLIIGQNEVCLDYFAGSGTTAHALINLNREDGGERKYILVEMGEYFNTVTKPRVQNVIYSDEWKNGKPTSRKGSSHCFKHLRLESYEDTLNNLFLKKGTVEEAMREEYLLNYALDVESRDSLLMLDAFKKPFGYKIKSTENNELKETEVDLVETFNYLIGLRVETMEIIRGYVVITGKTSEEKQVLVVWRDIDKHNNADLNDFFKKLKFNPLDGEFDQVFVNGDNNIENLKTGEERWKVRLIEHEFHKRMWENNG